MASTITAGNSTNGLGVTSDNTGALDIKTGTGAGTTAVSIDASQNITMPGNLTVTGILTAGAGTVYNLQSYVAPATWTKPTGLKGIKVTVVGAGGSSVSQPNIQTGSGGGGGGGAAISYIPASSIPGPVAVTAGPGTNSFGAFCSATAGGSPPPGTGTTIAAGGAGGVGSGGSFNITGSDGGTSASLAASSGGTGGSSILGGGGRGGVGGPVSNAGTVGGNYGGGGGGDGGTPVGTTRTARAGAPGIVIVEEFY